MARDSVPARYNKEIEITEAMERRIVERLKVAGRVEEIARLFGCQVKQVRVINEKHGIRKPGRRNA